MNWIQQYRLENEMKKEISQFIAICEEEFANNSLSEKIKLKRNKRLEHFLDLEDVEFEPLEYLNQFLDDFSDKVKFLSMPVAKYAYLDDDLDALNQFTKQLKTRNIAVETYAFENYNQIKSFLNKKLLKDICHVFSYKIQPEPTRVGNQQIFTHRLRAFFVNDDLINEWKKEERVMQKIKVPIDELQSNNTW